MSAWHQSYLTAHRWMGGRPLLTVTLYLGAWLAACAGLPHLKLDLSFRPLFDSGATDGFSTQEFEAVFGQSSGAFVLHIIERSEDLPNAEFVQLIDRLSSAARTVGGIDEVISITTMMVPRWHKEGVHIEPLISREVLDDTGLLAIELERIRGEAHRLIGLVSINGRYALVASRLAPPMEDLQARRVIMDDLNSRLAQVVPQGIVLQVTGVSYVEATYADQILRDQVIATSLTLLILMLLLWLQFRQLALVLVCVMPVGLSVMACLGLMGWSGQPVTIINSVVPAVMLVLGVADSVHMLVAWSGPRRAGEGMETAIAGMLNQTAKACALTTLTTMLGFLSLLAARLDVIRGFGVVIATGVLLAWLSNQVLVPWLLRWLQPGAPGRADRLNRWIARGLAAASQFSLRRPQIVLALGTLLVLGSVALFPLIDADQRFNEELPSSHPVRKTQELLEQQFGGFLGPDLSIRRRDGSTVLDEETRERLSLLIQEAGYLFDTKSVTSILDYLPDWVSEEYAAQGMQTLRTLPGLRYQVYERISPDNTQLAVMVRIGDVGTRKALEFRNDIASIAENNFGPEYITEIVGQWWLAQHGMRLILGDMLRSLATAVLVVLPILWLALRDRRLFISAVVANLVPLVIPLAFMAAMQIRLRIGTAVVLAIALGIAIDNTLHVITRLEALSHKNVSNESQVGAMMDGTGRAVVYTTLALMAGFLSMMSNELVAIRDMGLVAAVTFLGALLADLFLLPALLVVQSGEFSVGRKTGLNE